jgi:hypothetical protein
MTPMRFSVTEKSARGSVAHEQAMARFSIRRALRSVGMGLKTPEDPSFNFGASDAQAARDRSRKISLRSI